MKKSIRDLNPAELENKLVLMRVDFNVPMNEGRIVDDNRIQEAIPSIEYLVAHKARLMLMSHFGRPKDSVDPQFSLAPIAAHLSTLLKRPVKMAPDCIGDAVQAEVSNLKSGEILMLENTRFHPEETKNDPEFSKALINGATLFVQEAFGTAHRAHASTEGVARIIPGVAGLLVEKELHALGTAVESPKRPFVAIIGGSKVSSKLPILKKLLPKVDTLIIGGGMTYTFLKAEGFEIGLSLCEDDKMGDAREFLVAAKKTQTKLIWAIDHITVSEFKPDAKLSCIEGNALPKDQMGIDIGPKTVALIQDELQKAATILWNGPLGVFEIPAFARGTNEVAKTLAESDAITIIGGGDSAAAIKQLGLSSKMTHISTGGGASLAFLEGEPLPGIEILQHK